MGKEHLRESLVLLFNVGTLPIKSSNPPSSHTGDEKPIERERERERESAVYFRPRERASLLGRQFAVYFWPEFVIVDTAMMHVSCWTGPFGELCTGSEFSLQDSLMISWSVESCAYVYNVASGLDLWTRC